jgi:hypothetical protein
MGVGAAIATAVASISLADVAIGAGIGAVGGGLLSAVEGKPVLTGALLGGAAGGITGGAIGFGGALGAEAGIGSIAGDVIGGAAGGALGAGVTGGNPLIGAAGGAVAGGIAGSGIFSGPEAAPGAATPEAAGSAGGAVGGPGGGAVASAAPPSVVPPTQDFGTVGNVLADAPAPLSGGDPGAGLTGGGAPPTGSEMAPIDAAALRSQVDLSQTGGVTNTNVASADPGAGGGAAGAPTGPTAGGYTTADVAPLANAPSGTPTPPIPPLLDAGGNPTFDPAGNPVYATAGQATDAAAQGAASAAGYPASSGNTLVDAYNNPGFGTIGKALSSNASWLVPVAGLGLSAATSLGSGLPSQSGLTSTLQGHAASLAANGQQLQSYLQTGQLPPGVQNSITSATKSAQASIRSQYAARGMTGSSAEAQDLANVQQQAASQGADIATKLLQTGITESQLSDQIYGELLKTSIAQDGQLQSAVGNFASSLVPKAATNVTINQQATG